MTATMLNHSIFYLAPSIFSLFGISPKFRVLSMDIITWISYACMHRFIHWWFKSVELWMWLHCNRWALTLRFIIIRGIINQSQMKNKNFIQLSEINQNTLPFMKWQNSFFLKRLWNVPHNILIVRGDCDSQ